MGMSQAISQGISAPLNLSLRSFCWINLEIQRKYGSELAPPESLPISFIVTVSEVQATKSSLDIHLETMINVFVIRSAALQDSHTANDGKYNSKTFRNGKHWSNDPDMLSY